MARSRSTTKTKSYKIYFYRLHPTQPNLWFQDKDLFIGEALKYIDSLPFVSNNTTVRSKYMQDDQIETFLYCDVFSQAPPYKIQLCRSRRSDLPQVEDTGIRSNLQLQPPAGLLEPTSAVFFPNHVVGVFYNHFGPRFTRFVPYLQTKVPNCIGLSCGIILNHDAISKLQRVQSLREVNLKFYPSLIEAMKLAQLDISSAISPDDPIEVSLTMKMVEKDQRIDKRLLGQIKDWFEKGPSADLVEARISGDIAKANAPGVDEVLEEINSFDLLSDRIISTEDVELTFFQNRPTDEQQFEAIERAYRDRKDELDAAAEVRI